MATQESAAAAAAIEVYQRQMMLVAQMQQERARLTATVSVRDKRVTVTVNADNVVIETRFADDIDDLSYDEIAAAVTAASQQAAQEINRRVQELAAPLRGERAKRPKLSEMLEGIPEFTMPAPPEVSTAAPGSAERLAFEAPAGEVVAEESAMVFDDVEHIDRHRTTSGRSPEVSDSSW